jgi:protein-S-isoprenylcysteine O-methyltransferase Ste14
MYVHLARREECDAIAEFGEQYVRYASKTPAFFPCLSSSATEKATT